jgi:hypothetical protein
VNPGQTVIYHGSLRWMHGPTVYSGLCPSDCPECGGTNHVLTVPGTDMTLACVSDRSFTTVVPALPQSAA